MAHLTKLGNDDITRICEQFGIGSVISYSSMDGGAANTSYLIKTDTERFVLSVCDEKTISDIDVLTRLLNILKISNFPTTQLCRMKTGRYFMLHQDKPVILKRYIEGMVPDRLEQAMCLDFGAAIGKLHEVAPMPDIPKSFPYGMEFFSELFGVQDPFVVWLRSQYEKFKEKIAKDLPRGLIHGDIFSDNLVIANNKLVAILDFEEACNYYYVFDIGMAIVGCCVHGEEVDWDAARILIEGYETVRKLSQTETQQIPLMAEYAATATAFWRYRQYNKRNPSIEKKNIHEQMVHIAQQIAKHTLS